MTVDVLDHNVSVPVTRESDIFHLLCKKWGGLSPLQNVEEASITVHDLMQREAVQRARFAHEAAQQRARHGRITVQHDSMVGVLREPTHDLKPVAADYMSQAPLGSLVHANEVAFKYSRRIATFTPHPPTQPVVQVSDETLVIRDNSPVEVPTKTDTRPTMTLAPLSVEGEFDIPLDDKHLDEFQGFWEEKQGVRAAAKPKKRSRRYRVWQAILRFDVKDFINECLMGLGSSHYWD